MNWIRVKDKHPQEYTEVLAYDGICYELAEYRPDDYNMWYDTSNGESISTPTHWCEVTPPK